MQYMITRAALLLRSYPTTLEQDQATMKDSKVSESSEKEKFSAKFQCRIRCWGWPPNFCCARRGSWLLQLLTANRNCKPCNPARSNKSKEWKVQQPPVLGHHSCHNLVCVFCRQLTLFIWIKPDRILWSSIENSLALLIVNNIYIHHTFLLSLETIPTLKQALETNNNLPVIWCLDSWRGYLT